MSALPDRALDRRIFPRIAVDGRIKYKLPEDDQFSEGIMLDISQSGTLVSLDRELPIDTRLILRVESDQEQEAPIEIIADIIRIAVPVDGHVCAYGCSIVEAREI